MDDYPLIDAESMADSLETYLEMFDKYIIKSGLSAEEYEKAQKRVKKLIKHLRNDELDKVIDEERYSELLLEYERKEGEEY